MNGVLTVLYDADCGICTQTARALARLDSRSHIRLVPLQSAKLPGMPARGELLQSLHAVDSHGRWTVGAAAGVEIARRVPILWPLSVAARLPFAMQVGDALYAYVAGNRHRLSRLLGLKVCRVPGSRDGNANLA